MKASIIYSPFTNCHHYGRKGNLEHSCTIRKNGNNAKLIWVPKSIKTEPQRPKKVWVLKNVSVTNVIGVQDINAR